MATAKAEAWLRACQPRMRCLRFPEFTEGGGVLGSSPEVYRALSAQAPALPQPQLLPAGGSEEGGPRSASAGLPAAHWPMPGRVEFVGVVLRYAGQSAPALDGLDLDVPGGTKIGVCGRTGKLPLSCAP